MREDTVMKRQHQGLAVKKLDSVNPTKKFITDKYNNLMNLDKFKRINYFTKELLELRAWGLSEQDVISYYNNTSAVEKLIVWHKALPTYREGDQVYIEFKTGHPDMVGKQEIGDIGVQGGVTNGVAKVK